MADARARFSTYFAESKDPLNALVLVTPLFVAYQIGILGTGGVRNGVDFVTDVLWYTIAVVVGVATGAKAQTADVLIGYLAFNALVLAGAVAAIVVLKRRGHFRPRTWPWLLVESFVYALFFGSAVHLLIRASGLDVLLAAGGTLQTMSPLTKLVASIGAGLYEEIVFRLILTSGLFALFARFLVVPKLGAMALAIVVSSAVFSFVHHLGPMGDPFTLSVFVFRFFAGVLLALIYSTRGFAVAVYTHAFYDVLVFFLRG
jgi:membrane protease YdiL (CAAX protease family)